MSKTNSFIDSLKEPFIALIRDCYQGMYVEIKERTGQDDILVILQKQGAPAPEKNFISINFIRHKKTAATSFVRVNRELENEYQSIYQLPYRSTCVVMVEGEDAEDIAFGIHLRLQSSNNARTNFISNNMSIMELGEIVETDYAESDTSYTKRRRFLVTVNHVVQFVESSGYVKRAEIVNTDEPQNVIIIEQQDNINE